MWISKDQHGTFIYEKNPDFNEYGYSFEVPDELVNDILGRPIRQFEVTEIDIAPKYPIYSRAWEMPNSNTFDIKCIRNLINKYLSPNMLSIDPFANKNRLAKITNDLDPAMETEYCMDALDFLKIFDDNSVDFVLYDPPFSPRQVSECYKKLGKTVNMQTTQAKFWGDLKKEITRITKPNGIVISFGWNSNGIGKTKGFEIIELLTVAHGGQHNDTICTVERKISI